MKSLLTLVDDLNQAALNSGLLHATRGIKPATRRAADSAECAAAFAVQDRIEKIRRVAAKDANQELFELLDGS